FKRAETAKIRDSRAESRESRGHSRLATSCCESRVQPRVLSRLARRGRESRDSSTYASVQLANRQRKFASREIMSRLARQSRESRVASLTEQKYTKIV
ncbi:Unknown protein, partial [Striga hermonthica]